MLFADRITFPLILTKKQLERTLAECHLNGRIYKAHKRGRHARFAICSLSATKVKGASNVPKISHAGDGGPQLSCPRVEHAQCFLQDAYTISSSPSPTQEATAARAKIPPLSGHCGPCIPVPSDFIGFPLNLIDAAENKEMGRVFDHTNCRYEVRLMSSLALRKDSRAATEAPAISISASPASPSKPANASLEGILLFSGIGFGLIVLAAIFSYLQLPPPYF